PLRGASTFRAYVRMPPFWPLHHQDQRLREAIGSYFPAILLTLRWSRIAASHWYRDTPAWDIALKLTYLAPIGALLATAVVDAGAAARDMLRRRTAAFHGPRLLVLALATASLLAFPPPRDWAHVVLIVPIPLLLALSLARRAMERSPR